MQWLHDPIERRNGKRRSYERTRAKRSESVADRHTLSTVCAGPASHPIERVVDVWHVMGCETVGNSLLDEMIEVAMRQIECRRLNQASPVPGE